DLDEPIRQRVQGFLEGVREFAPNARWVRPESLHVTLKFIGEKPPAAVEEIQNALAGLRCESFSLNLRGYGFFPSPGSARVFWVGISAGPALEALAKTVDAACAQLGIPREEHAFSPHLTLARRAGGSGAPQRRPGDDANPGFRRLREKLTARP